MNKRFENKTANDPGRFRYPVTFIQQVTVLQPDGSQGPGYAAILTTRAIREPITRRFNVLGDMTLAAGENLLNNYWYFTIRYQKDFTPKKDMLFSAPDGVYTINAIPELDVPPHYWRMLCVKTDLQITT